MFDPAKLIASADEIDNRLGPIPGRSSDRISVELRQAAREIASLRDTALAACDASDRVLEDESPAVKRAKDFFWKKADEYDHEKLMSIYNDMHELQGRVETITLSQALEAMDLALQFIDRLTTKGG